MTEICFDIGSKCSIEQSVRMVLSLWLTGHTACRESICGVRGLSERNKDIRQHIKKS